MRLSSTEDVFECLSVYVASAALGAALELGLPWILARRRMNVSAVARALRIPLRRCHYWLQLLESLGLIESDAEGYVPSAVARASIIEAYSQDGWAYLAQEERERFPSFVDLSVQLRKRGRSRHATGLDTGGYLEKLVQDKRRARRFTRMLYELHLSLADELTGILDMTDVRRLMDLGGGSGVVSHALLRRHPQLTSVVVEMKNVCIAGRELAEDHDALDRVTYWTADFVRDELPGGFDMVLVCDVGCFSEALFRKLRRALNLGGRLVVVEYLGSSGNIESPALLCLTLQESLADPALKVTTVTTLERQLARSGFRVLDDSHVLAGGRRVIQAQKGTHARTGTPIPQRHCAIGGSEA